MMMQHNKPSVKPEISWLRILPIVRIIRWMLCLHNSVIIFNWWLQLRLHRRTIIVIIWLFNDKGIALWSRWWGWSFHRLWLSHSRLCLCLCHNPQTAIMWTLSFLPNDITSSTESVSISWFHKTNPSPKWLLAIPRKPQSMNKLNTNLSNYPEKKLNAKSAKTSSKAFVWRRSAQPRFVHNNMIRPRLPPQTLCHVHTIESVEGTGTTTWRNRQHIASIAWRGHYDKKVFMWRDKTSKVKSGE